MKLVFHLTYTMMHGSTKLKFLHYVPTYSPASIYRPYQSTVKFRRILFPIFLKILHKIDDHNKTRPMEG
jgi:hypothetical protein